MLVFFSFEWRQILQVGKFVLSKGVLERCQELAEYDDLSSAAWHGSSSTKHCIRSRYCTPWRIHKGKQCCFNPSCRCKQGASRQGVLEKCQLFSGGMFSSCSGSG